jgi:hypothetical protein
MFPKLVGREKFLKCYFLIIQKLKIIRNDKVKNKTKLEKGKNKAHNTRIHHVLYGVSPPPPVYSYYMDSGFDNDHSEDRHSSGWLFNKRVQLFLLKL